jgi:hypothetical protein
MLCISGALQSFSEINGSVADEQQEGVARDERLGVPWAAEDQFKKRIKLSECSLWTSRRN